MSAKPITCRFALPTITGRGFAMGHQAAHVSLVFSVGESTFSLNPIPAAEARDIAKAIIEAADFAETREPQP